MTSNFVDYVKIFCRSGKGGSGSLHFRREKSSSCAATPNFGHCSTYAIPSISSQATVFQAAKTNLQVPLATTSTSTCLWARWPTVRKTIP